MKKHNILKVVLLSILVVALLTWILPSASFNSELVIGTRAQLGIFDIMSYFVEIFRYFPYVIVVVLTIGMFYGVAYKIPSYRALLDKIVEKFKNKEAILLSAMMIIITLIVSVTGLNFAILFVFPFVISIVLLMGYNKLVAASVTVGSTIVGMLGTTLGVNTTSYINYILSTDVYNEMVAKIVLLVIGLVLLIYNVLNYAKKIKNDTDKVVELVPNSIVKEKVVVKEEKIETKVDAKKAKTTKQTKSSKETKNTKSTKSSKSTKTSKTTKKTSTKTRANDLKSVFVKKVSDNGDKQKKIMIWPFVIIFDLVVILLGVSTFNWTDVLNVDWFTTALTAVEEFTIFDFPIFAKILGNVGEFGLWSLNYEIPTLIVLATCFMAFIYGIKFDDFLSGIQDGIKKAMKPGVYMFMIYLVLIIVTYNPFQLNFTKFLMELTNDLNVITMTIIAMIASVFNIECVYTAQSTLPYVTSIVTDSTLYPLLSVIFQAVYGLTMLVAPTSVILLGTLTYLDVSYTQWLKHIWKLFLELLLVLVVVFLILFLI